MAQIHLDLSLVAALTDMPSSKELSWQYAGQGFHYLEDIGNQIHTVQVGLFDFFFDAAMERLKNGSWDEVWDVTIRPIGNVHCEPQ